jgi:hypothetical protein
VCLPLPWLAYYFDYPETRRGTDLMPTPLLVVVSFPRLISAVITAVIIVPIIVPVIAVILNLWELTVMFATQEAVLEVTVREAKLREKGL